MGNSNLDGDELRELELEWLRIVREMLDVDFLLDPEMVVDLARDQLGVAHQLLGVACPSCRGRGQSITTGPCAACRGTGCGRG